MKKNNDTTHLPLESCYLGRSALRMLTGEIPNPAKCFSLIRKAKSARVRQDLLEKSAQSFCRSVWIHSWTFHSDQVPKHPRWRSRPTTQRSLDLDEWSMNIVSNQIEVSCVNTEATFSILLFHDEFDAETIEFRLSQIQSYQQHIGYHRHCTSTHASRRPCQSKLTRQNCVTEDSFDVFLATLIGRRTSAERQ